MKKIFKIHYLFFLIAGILSACNLLEENPEDRFVVGNFYSSETDAEAAINAIYARLYGDWQGTYELQFSWLTDLTTDDMKNGIGMASSTNQDLEYLRYNTENPIVRNVWQVTYDGITRANTAIDAIPDVTMDETKKNQFLGEAKFLRALFYFNAVRLWGDVPLVTKLESLDDAYTTRSPKEEVYSQIIEDLTFATNNLPKEYTSKDIGKATEGTAKILLAKVYLTRENWQDAANVLSEVISNEAAYGYGLNENYRDNWEIATENGMEMVFSVQFMESPGNANGIMYAIAPKYSVPGGGGVPGISGAWESDIPTQELYNLFDDYDERKAATFNLDYVSPTNSQVYTSSIPLIYKYFETGENICGNCDVNFHILRYSDAILMYAEALNELGKTNEALPYINRIRERAFNDSEHNYSGLSQSELREKIKLERRLEFVFEGNRFFDLVRWGDFVERMKEHGQVEAQLAGEPLKTTITNNVKDFKTLFPVPQRERDLNPDLSQNTGW
ncbi:RagB/SusD family nutrient uptake outer membrane protein [Maribellus comscasis]|uniref:RagB/SusD family nutrient uptake outer membrane protein n=1 Tax=Maribellus comscasis TaxID=2681766 RepID=A0A6I6K7C6_9BACT|nr:RagB/SusD family nutrient uptake outer membrane protein [Maribellus comscasis]QGY47543.1 RagB/SusD family nutrient uptake outer membrane protein [Maribellus comscasis]